MELNHATEEQLELYLQKRLSHPDVLDLEEHLIVCEDCRIRLEREENWVLAARTALREDPAPVSRWHTIQEFIWAGAGWIRQPAFAAGFAVLLLTVATAFYMNYRGESALPPVAVLQLVATRGAMPAVRESREIDLVLTDSPSGVAAKVVSTDGSAIWEGETASAPEGSEIRVPKHLNPGTYLARTYSTPGQLLHEYGFRIQ